MSNFRLFPLKVEDFDTTIVRIEKSQMKKLGIMREAKESYEKIEKFPSFFIISGPWQVTFLLKQ